MVKLTTSTEARTASWVGMEPLDNRAWGFFGDSVRRAWEIDPQVVEQHLEKTTAGSRTASCVPSWPSREPIGERGGLNLYAMVHNNAVTWMDRLGLEKKNPYECCTPEKIEKGKETLLRKYAEAHQILTVHRIPHRGGRGSANNCYQVSQAVANWMEPVPDCWECKHVRRMRRGFLWRLYDHWSIVCEAKNKDGEVVDRALFDYWKDRPAGERPETEGAFEDEYDIESNDPEWDQGVGIDSSTCTRPMNSDLPLNPEELMRLIGNYYEEQARDQARRQHTQEMQDAISNTTAF